jgi:ligand-binding sensor domain-containing protein
MPTGTTSRRLRRLLLLTASLFTFFGIPQAQSLEPTTRLTQYAHRSWRTGDAGLMGTPQSIAQTRDGYIWISTENGLFRFDGMTFNRWNPPAGESLPSVSTWYLFVASNGSLYVGTDRGLARIRDGHVYTYPESLRWPGPFLEDNHGDLWMGVSGAQSDPNALCKIGTDRLQWLGARNGFRCVRGLSNMASRDGHLWVGSAEGICRWKPGTLPEAELLPALSRRKGLSRVTSLAAGADGALWAGLDLTGPGAGLLRFNNGKWRSYKAPGVDGSSLDVSLFWRTSVDHFGLVAVGRVSTDSGRGASITLIQQMALAIITFLPSIRIGKAAFGLLPQKVSIIFAITRY